MGASNSAVSAMVAERAAMNGLSDKMRGRGVCTYRVLKEGFRNSSNSLSCSGRQFKHVSVAVKYLRCTIP